MAPSHLLSHRQKSIDSQALDMEYIDEVVHILQTLGPRAARKTREENAQLFGASHPKFTPSDVKIAPPG